ncbi:MAG TPA: geranylgeranyl reductase family protein [Candidatus Tripitaka californicus]|uniref:geranylgeranyl reductase family protein n=1 Tax=Candidatus Tripitaka californicus TaxID=3367616 RepID=UPI004025A5A6
MKVYDVIVVGSGPAGSIAAYTLARDNFQVALIEKKRHPRSKPCGGGLQEKARRLLPFDVSGVVERVVSGMVFQLGLKDKFTRRSTSPIVYNLSREPFDSLLVRKASEGGATVIEGEGLMSLEYKEGCVSLLTENNRYLAKVVIGADGAASVVRRVINPRGISQEAIGLICELEKGRASASGGQRALTPPDDLFIIDWGTVPAGYAWIFPKEKTWTTGAMVPRSLSKHLIGYLKAFLEKEGLKLDMERIKAHPIPTRTPGEPISSRWGVLVGDAAGLTDPFTGEGLYYAIASGQRAAYWVKEHLQRGADLRLYEEDIDKGLMEEIIVAGKLRGFFNTFSRYVHGLYRRNDRLWMAFCEVMRGDRTLEGLRRVRTRPPGPILRYLERFTSWYESRQVAKFKPPWL